MKCSRFSCKASVAIDISGYMLSQDVNDKSKRTSTAVLLDIDRLIRISKYEPQLDEKDPIFFSLYYNVLLRQQIRLYPFLKSDKTFVFIYLSLMNQNDLFDETSEQTFHLRKKWIKRYFEQNFQKWIKLTFGKNSVFRG